MSQYGNTMNAFLNSLSEDVQKLEQFNQVLHQATEASAATQISNFAKTAGFDVADSDVESLLKEIRQHSASDELSEESLDEVSGGFGVGFPQRPNMPIIPPDFDFGKMYPRG